jgi:hypothetical protein
VRLRNILFFFGALHAAMLAYDAAHLERFVRADRAEQRMSVIVAFERTVREGGDVAAFLASRGVPGDWLPQALLYLAGGELLIIVAQVLLVLASIAWVRDIARRVLPGEPAASAAAILYGLLPHTLALPHQLTSEAFFVPLIILGFRAAFGAPSGLALAAAALIRPVVLLWPLVYAWFHRAERRALAPYLALAFAPVLAWAFFILAMTGAFSLGKAGHDLGHNLYNRMHRMSAALPEAQRPARKPAGETTATLGEYLRFIAAHPGAAVAHSARDVVTMGVKSGVERLALDYFDGFAETRQSLQDTQSGWRARVEKRGYVALVDDLMDAQPGLVLLAAGAALLFLAFMALAAWGAWHSRAWLLTAFVLYVFATAQAVDAAQSRHRAPAEFALSILAVAGWLRLRRAQPVVRTPAPWQPILHR